ncbi:MAG: hypothetical protein VYC85_01140 [Pseudomonadota bacterium]|nr:hypothetical protein [Pseudomonadota bacterium]
MTIFKTVHAFFLAATAFLKVLPIIEIRKIEKQIEGYEDEMHRLALSGSPSAKLRIETIAKRKQRAAEQVGFIRSAHSDVD